jgi:hypothetical protein
MSDRHMLATSTCSCRGQAGAAILCGSERWLKACTTRRMQVGFGAVSPHPKLLAASTKTTESGHYVLRSQ